MEKIGGNIIEVKVSHPMFGEIILHPVNIKQTFIDFKKALERVSRKNKKRLTLKEAKRLIKNYYGR